MRFLSRLFAFRWYSNSWSTRQKVGYVALYVTLFRLSLIPILTLAEKGGYLTEGSFSSLGGLVVILVLWFAFFQMVTNFIVVRGDF